MAFFDLSIEELYQYQPERSESEDFDQFWKQTLDDVRDYGLNARFEPVDFGKFTPYIGAGVGSAWLKGSTNDTVVRGSRSETNFAWQGEAGIQYELTERIDLKLGYRYIDMGTLDIDLVTPGLASAGNFNADITSHEVLFGVRYSF